MLYNIMMKAKLPSTEVRKSLDELTLDYWCVSQSYHNRPDAAPMSVGDAIDTLTNIGYWLNPTRAIVQVSGHLLEQIVEGD